MALFENINYPKEVEAIATDESQTDAKHLTMPMTALTPKKCSVQNINSVKIERLYSKIILPSYVCIMHKA